MTPQEDQPPQARLLSISRAEPPADIAIATSDTPPAAPVCRVTRQVRLEGPNRFPERQLTLPLERRDFAGIDPATVRVVRRDPHTGDVRVVPRSGLNLALGFAWANVDTDGEYVAVGLPRDRVARDWLLAVVRVRAAAASLGPAAAPQRAALEQAFATVDPEQLRILREQIAADEVATSSDPVRLMATRRGKGGAVKPPDLPGGKDIRTYLADLHALLDAPAPFAEEVLLRELPAATLPTQRAADGPRIAAIAGGPRIAPVAADWWMYHRDPVHSGIIAQSHITSANVAGLQLRYRLPLDGPTTSVPAVVNGTIYVGTGNSRRAFAGRGGTLYSVDLVTGVPLQSFTFSTPPLGGSRQGLAGIACTPAVVGNRIYFSALDGKLYCLDSATFQPVWVTDMRHADALHRQPVTHAVPAEGWSSPLVINGRVYVGWGESESNAFGFIYCLDAATGVVLWLFCTTVPPGQADSEPNVVPVSAAGLSPMPAPFRVGPDPLQRGGSPWSSCAYDPVTDRIIVGTGNVLPQHPLPQVKYALGVISLDARTGGSPRFFQPANADNYRPDDDDVDVPPGPLLYWRGNQRVVAIGSKNGSFFLLDADTLQPLARRQLLPRAGGNGGFPGDTGRRLDTVDPHPLDPEEGRRTENFYGIFGTATVSYPLQRLFVGVGGFAFGIGTPGIDSTTTAFLRALNWSDLTDAWVTATGPDGVTRYVNSTPPMYSTPGETGFASPVVVNDVVLMSTSRPGLYAFDAASGLCLWSAPGFGPPVPNSFTLGPAVFGDYVVVGSASLGLLVYSL